MTSFIKINYKNEEQKMLGILCKVTLKEKVQGRSTQIAASFDSLTRTETLEVSY